MASRPELLFRAAILLAATVSSVLAAEHDAPVAQAQRQNCGKTLNQRDTTLLPGAADCQADGQANALLQAVAGLSVGVQELTPVGSETAGKSDFDHILLPQSGYHEIVTSVDAPLPSGATHPSKKPFIATQEEPEATASTENPEATADTENQEATEATAGTENPEATTGAGETPEGAGETPEGAGETPETTGATSESGGTVAEPTTSAGTESSNATITPAPQATNTSVGNDGLPSPFDFDSFNCTAGLSRWETGWSAQKKAWCCNNANVGCPFNCTAGLPRWRLGWSNPKKDWCCKNKGLGCKFNCSAGALRWKRGWSQMKKDWCCKNTNFGCGGNTSTAGVKTGPTTMPNTSAPRTTTVITTTVTTTPFDCQAGLPRAAVGWSKEKQAWCCKDQKVGCVKGDDVLFDCTQGSKSWEIGWSAQKKEFCCRTSRVGCEEGSEESSEGTDEEMKRLEGKNQGEGEGKEEGEGEGKEEGEGDTKEENSHGGGESEKGDEGGESEEGEEGSKEESDEDGKQFNCSAGVLHWKEGWSETKKAYCCNAEGVGCTGTRTKPCLTTYDPMVYSTLRYSAAKPGSPCVFGADPRDEGWHCILDGMAYGTFGWCWTDLQKTTYGACSQDCPLFSQQKVLGDRMKRMEMKLDRLLNASGVNYSDIPNADSPLPTAPPGRTKRGEGGEGEGGEGEGGEGEGGEGEGGEGEGGEGKKENEGAEKPSAEGSAEGGHGGGHGH